MYEQASEKIVPSIGIEPATPLHPKQTVSPMPQSILSGPSKSVPGTQYLSPTSSISSSHRSLGRRSDDNDGQRSEKRHGSSDSDGSERRSRKPPSKKSGVWIVVY